MTDLHDNCDARLKPVTRVPMLLDTDITAVGMSQPLATIYDDPLRVNRSGGVTGISSHTHPDRMVRRNARRETNRRFSTQPEATSRLNSFHLTPARHRETKPKATPMELELQELTPQRAHYDGRRRDRRRHRRHGQSRPVASTIAAL